MLPHAYRTSLDIQKYRCNSFFPWKKAVKDKRRMGASIWTWKISTFFPFWLTMIFKRDLILFPIERSSFDVFATNNFIDVEADNNSIYRQIHWLPLWQIDWPLELPRQAQSQSLHEETTCNLATTDQLPPFYRQLGGTQLCLQSKHKPAERKDQDWKVKFLHNKQQSKLSWSWSSP